MQALFTFHRNIQEFNHKSDIPDNVKVTTEPVVAAYSFHKHTEEHNQEYYLKEIAEPVVSDNKVNVVVG